MIEMRWVITHKQHKRLEGFTHKVRTLQYRTWQVVHAPNPVEHYPNFSGHWTQWQDVPEVEAEVTVELAHGT